MVGGPTKDLHRSALALTRLASSLEAVATFHGSGGDGGDCVVSLLKKLKHIMFVSVSPVLLFYFIYYVPNAPSKGLRAVDCMFF